MKFQAVKGMSDVLPGEVEAWQELESRSRACFEAQGFREIRTPLLEATDLFARSIGEATDIVHKEMYTFEDRGSRSLTLRPEMTASVVRAAVEHALLVENRVLRLYYGGAMFRAERPQAGRRRQFSQWGVEVLNAPAGPADLEVVALLDRYLRSLGLARFEIHVNSLGEPATRAAYQGELADYFRARKDGLCEDCLYRLERNVLRILDCKNAACQPVVSKAPLLELKGRERDGWEALCAALRQEGVSFALDPRLVRGLDYYTGCVFEARAEGLGSQNAIGAGGRYDGLVKSLGGPDVGACGFAVGVERILEALQHEGARLAEARGVYFALLDGGRAVRDFARERLAVPLAQAGFHPAFDWQETSLTKHLKRASKAGYRHMVILGATELEGAKPLLKDLGSGEQKAFSPEALVEHLKRSC